MSEFVLGFAQRNFLLMQLFLCPFALGYVYDDRREKRRALSNGWDQHRTDVRRHCPTIFRELRLLDAINPSLPFMGFRETSFGVSAILFMANVSSRSRLEFGFGIAEHFLKSQVGRDEAAVRSNQCNSR